MSSHAGIAALLRELYTIGAHTLQPIARVPNAAHLLLLAERADGSAWVVKGYRTGAALPAAIRFGVAYLAAWHFALAARHGYDAAIARRLARARNRFALSTAMAEIALGRIAAS